MSTARVAIVAPPELTTGFRLAGAVTHAAHDKHEAAEVVLEVMSQGEQGVIGVYEPYYTGFDRGLRDRLEQSVIPVVIAVPSGFGTEEFPTRRARIAALLRRAVGYHITFGEADHD